MDFSSKLIIKARLGDDVRKIPVHTEDMSMDDLLLMMQRVFSQKISTSDDITVKYTDEDGDLITLSDYSDLHFAMHSSRTLKLTLFVNNQMYVDPITAAKLKDDLTDIREKANCLIQRLDKTVQVIEGASDCGRTTDGQRTAQSAANPPPDVLNTQAREFDPLQQQQQPKVESAMNHFNGNSNSSRPETPASSVSLSSNRQPVQQQQMPPTNEAPPPPPVAEPQQQPAVFSPIAQAPPEPPAVVQQQQPDAPMQNFGPPSSGPAQQYFNSGQGHPPFGGPGQHPPPPGMPTQMQQTPKPFVPPPVSMSGDQGYQQVPPAPGQSPGPVQQQQQQMPMPPGGMPQFGNQQTGGFQPPQQPFGGMPQAPSAFAPPPQQQHGQFPPSSTPQPGMNGPPSTPGIPTPRDGTPGPPSGQMAQYPPQHGSPSPFQPNQGPPGQMPPMNNQQMGYPPQQQPGAGPPPGMPPMGPPPSVTGLPPGANPFSRGNAGGQYIRPAY